MNLRKIKVIVVDDSFFMRKLIREILAADESINIIGEAHDGLEAIKYANKFHPDVILMDYNLPKLNGEEATKKIMENNEYVPAIIMLSASTKEGAEITMKCLNAGAVDFIAKPSGELSFDIKNIEREIIRKIKIVAEANLYKYKNIKKSFAENKYDYSKTLKALVIGASTGGPSLITELMKEIPSYLNLVIFIIQHMDKKFTNGFSEHLDKYSSYKVKEAKTNDEVKGGMCFVAPGGWHMKIKQVDNNKKEKIIILLSKDQKKKGFRPSIDVSMVSVSKIFKDKTIGLILTGMGSDGLDGVITIKNMGGTIISQSLDTAIIPSMPKIIIDSGQADYILKPQEMVETIIEICGKI